LAQGDHLTVGDPRKHRRHLVCRDGNHHLVKQRHTLGDLFLQDQRVSVAEPREHRRVRIGEALCDLLRLDEARLRGVCVSLEQERQCLEHPQPSLLDAVAAAVLQEPAAAGDPTHRRSHIASEEESERLPERTACGTLRFAAVQPRVVRAHPGVFTIDVSADHVCGNRKALEILAAQLPLAMRRRQTGKRVPPHPTLERSAASLYSISDGHRLHDMPGRALRHASPFVRRRRH
jgi:hypothetical protein